jgi:hypothetical protein
LPALEAFLSERDRYAQRRVIGVEVVPHTDGGSHG